MSVRGQSRLKADQPRSWLARQLAVPKTFVHRRGAQWQSLFYGAADPARLARAGSVGC